MIEFSLVFIAVVAVISTKWETVSRWHIGISGLLSFALGVRVMALVTATYLFPCFAAQLFAEEPVPAASSEDTPKLEVERPAAAKAEPQPDAAESSTGAATPGAASAKPIGPDSTTESSIVPNDERSARPPVPIITNVSYLTANRPSWVESGPTYEGELFKVAVRGGPYRTVRDCESDLKREVDSAVREFINEHLRAPYAYTFFRYSLNDLRTRKVVREQFSEQLETSLGLMNQVHAQLVFDSSFRDELDNRWSEIKSKSRLAQTGLGTGIVLLFLGTLFSFLKLDTATKGYYTGRLQFGAAATILALVAASVLLMKWIPWM